MSGPALVPEVVADIDEAFSAFAAFDVASRDGTMGQWSPEGRLCAALNTEIWNDIHGLPSAPVIFRKRMRQWLVAIVRIYGREDPAELAVALRRVADRLEAGR